MFKLVLVDDEKIVLNNIARGIEWNKFEFELVGTFYSATETLDFLEKNHVDCIISDIKMPGIDGLRLAEIVREKYPNIEFIILSAFANFDFAKKAMDEGVVDYIVKPITYRKMSTSLEKARKKLRQSEKRIFSARQYSDKHKTFSKLINGKYDDVQDAVNDLKSCGIKIDSEKTKFARLRIWIEDYDEYIQNYWPYDAMQFQNAFSFVVEGSCPGIILMTNGYSFAEIMYVCNSTNLEFDRLIGDVVLLIQMNCSEFLNLQVCGETIAWFDNINEFIAVCATGNNINIEGDVLDFIDRIGDGDMLSVQKFMNENINKNKNNFFYLKNFIKCFETELYKYIDVKKCIGEGYLESVSGKSSQELFKYINYFVECVGKYFNTKKIGALDVVNTIKEYVEEHYFESITLADISKKVYMSESHISRMFKKRTGESIVVYINRVRLAHACELLTNSEMLIDEICYNVGYNSRNMFYKYFKLQYGKTPNEYRRDSYDK